MRVAVVGGGPAGLCFGMLMKLRRPSADVTVIERGGRDKTYGWGITLPRRTISQLEPVDSTTAREITDQSVTWDQIHVFHCGRRVEIAGTRLLGISRLVLLNILRGRCRAVGVRLEFESAVEPTSLPDCDLLVVADGARSSVRGSFASDFGTSSREGRNRYVWLGTPHVFEGLAFCVAQTEHGPLVAHGYPFSPEASTFVVECGDDTWQNAGLAERSSEDTFQYLASVFVESLCGRPLLFRRSGRWTRFVHVRNERWYRDRMVLIGDAAHAVHFSVGSGTMLALEDAITLVASLDEYSDVPAALRRFEQARKPILETFQTLEQVTVARLERMHQFVTLEPLELAYQLLSR
jgi:2-polyprenyl-6-methoxyphenol hydroxylase-like FAD-dependent oxidoreductase